MLPAAQHQKQVASAPALILLYTDSEDTVANVDEFIHPGFDDAKRARVRGNFLRNYAGQPLEQRQASAHAIGYVALGYLLLAAEAMGYQTSPMIGFDPAAMIELFGLRPTVTIPALVAIGRGDEPGLPHHRHSVERITRFV
jgi:nitroreductase